MIGIGKNQHDHLDVYHTLLSEKQEKFVALAWWTIVNKHIHIIRHPHPYRISLAHINERDDEKRTGLEKRGAGRTRGQCEKDVNGSDGSNQPPPAT